MRADTAAFIYARSDSRRLPGKIFSEIGGRKVLDIVHARASRLNVGKLVVLTTCRSVDDSIAAHCASKGYECFRGHPADLVRRTVKSINAYNPGLIVRVNGDCPFFEPSLVNKALAYMEGENGPDMVSNIVSRSFPYGVSVECVNADAYLRHAGSASTAEREHVTSHLYRLTKCLLMYSMRDTGGDHSNIRLTLDTPEDAKVLKQVCSGHDVVFTPYWEMLDICRPSCAFEPVLL